MDFISLIPPARALLGWSQSDLAQAAGMNQASIANIENGKSEPQHSSIERIRGALERAGVEFLPTGVQMRVTPVRYYDGPNWYLDLLDDVLAAAPDEMLIENVDDQKSSPEVIDRHRNIRRAGIALRMTTKEGNTYLTAPSSCYRFIPGNYYKNWIVMIFGDHVAVSIAGERGCMAITDHNLADAMRNRFNLLWHVLPELNIETTAAERI